MVNSRNKKFKWWKLKKEEREKAEAILTVDLKKERIFEVRVYPVPFEGYLKLFSKQNLKTGQIETVVIQQEKSLKRVLGAKTFEDENDYKRTIKPFELDLSLDFDIDPKTVSITTVSEFEKFLKEHSNIKRKKGRKKH